MPLYRALILGAVQGVTEFWPVSSTAHIALFQWFFHWGKPHLAFTVALHAGTLVAVVFFFRYRLWSLIKAWFASVRDQEIGDDRERRLAWFLVLATIPAVIAGLLLHDASELLESMPLFMAFMLAVVGGLLWYADSPRADCRDLGSMNMRDALAVGIAQAIALAPGVSRSGATMTTALYAGYSREQAAEFAFLLSIPVIAGAVLYEGAKVAKDGMPPGLGAAMLAGAVTAAVVGWFAVKYLLSFLQKGSFKPFVWYRFALAIAVLIVALAR